MSSALSINLHDVISSLSSVNDDMFLDSIDPADSETNDRVITISRMYQTLCDEISAIKRREAGLKAHRDSLAAKAELAKERIISIMSDASLDKVLTDDMSVSLRNAPASVVIEDEKAIADKYFIAQEPKLSKQLIKAALKSGVNVRGASLVESKTLSIKGA